MGINSVLWRRLRKFVLLLDCLWFHRNKQHPDNPHGAHVARHPQSQTRIEIPMRYSYDSAWHFEQSQCFVVSDVLLLRISLALDDAISRFRSDNGNFDCAMTPCSWIVLITVWEWAKRKCETVPKPGIGQYVPTRHSMTLIDERSLNCRLFLQMHSWRQSIDSPMPTALLGLNQMWRTKQVAVTIDVIDSPRPNPSLRLSTCHWLLDVTTMRRPLYFRLTFN